LKNRRLCIFAALVLFLLPSPMLFSETVLDWGGFAGGSGEFTDIQEFDIENTELSAQGGLWLRTQFSDAFNVYGRGVYIYTDNRPYFGDLNNLYASGRFILGESEGTGSPTLLSYRAGRFRFSEFTGYVLSHNLDGFRLNYEHAKFSLEGGAGYTGLTFIPSSGITISENDLLVQGDAPDHGYALSPPKVIETLKLTVPDFSFGQDIILNWVFQQDLQEAGASGGRMHTVHSGVGSRGRIAPSIYQNTFFYHNLGIGEYYTSAFLFGGRLSYYNTDLYYTRVQLRALFSSGDNEYTNSFYGGYSGDGISTHFIPLSSSPGFGIVFSPEIGNISLAELSFSIRPFSKTYIRSLEKLETSLKGLVFFRNTGGKISEIGINNSSEENYLGTELNLNIKARPASDFIFSLSGGLFMPNNYTESSAFVESVDSMQASVRLDLSFNF
ncbi:MAG: hypothetical protein ACLFNZ_12225, partial [Spirochaetaceae bacterium]